MGSRYQTARVGDIDIHYDLADYTVPWRETPPETFLLYHGYARNMHFWRPWVPLLAADYRVLWFDARGCGETTKPPPGSRMSFSQLAGDAIGLMDKLGIERVHWVGESSGGIVGMTAALEHPHRLSTLTLCDTPFRRSANIATTYTLGEPTRAAAFDKYGVGGWCRQTLSYRIDTTKASPALCEWYIEQMDRTPKHCAVAMDEAVAAGDVWPRLPEIKTPTLILSGAKSPIAQEAEVKAMQQRMPAAKLVAFEGYGHGVNMTAPDRCVGEVRRFVAERQKAAASA
ncbi:MAG TPA: alpha/beta hydrolase [Burkholderiales bacterium]|nr:alpha/beta hydrolase [Burkholderiales bacterium]